MPLGRTQTQIIDKLQEMGKLNAEQKAVLLARPDEPTGDQLDQILQADHHITMFQLLLAKCRALGLVPYNVARYRVHSSTFEKIEKQDDGTLLVHTAGHRPGRSEFAINRNLAGHRRHAKAPPANTRSRRARAGTPRAGSSRTSPRGPPCARTR